MFGVPLRIFFGIATAMLLTRPKRGVNGYRTLFFMPSMAPTVGAALVFVYLFNPVDRPDQPDRSGDPRRRPRRSGSATRRWAKPALLILGLWGIGDAIVHLPGRAAERAPPAVRGDRDRGRERLAAVPLRDVADADAGDLLHA